ncbi:MAG: hypothetical protein H6773_01245 [Pseudomonadales bacterium]|nr:hypothetical protein [Candidatus Woesebacteria bacterium]MCB9800781.1 hypothetical protein [Pseudomonadales bacterium]
MKQKITWIFLTYIRLAAKLQLLKNRPTIVGLTGSAGKTSTQHAVVAALLPEFKLKYSFNANSETGLPLSILGIKPHDFSIKDWLRIAVLTIWKLLTNWERYNVLVAEMGIDSPLPPKNMAYLLTILKPNIGIMLNAAPMHSEPFDFLVTETDPVKRRAQLTRLIAEEKGRIVTEIPSTATAVVNTDQKELADLLPNVSAQVVSFGENKDAAIRIISSIPSLKGTEFVFEVSEKEHPLFIKDYALAEHYGYTFAAALATAVAFDVPIKKAIRNIETHFTVEPGRSTLIEGKNGVTILDSSYNSSTKPTVEMLEMLPKLGAKRCIALLGDIREIGSMAEIEHTTVAEAAARHCQAVFLVGPQMKQYGLPVLERKNIQTQWFATAVEAADFLETFLQQGDILLVKSSQNTLLLEIAVEQLMSHPELAEELLCRRGEYWNMRRKKLM